MSEVLYLIPFVLGGLGFWFDGKADDYLVDDAVRREYARLSTLMFKAFGVCIAIYIGLFIFGVI